MIASQYRKVPPLCLRCASAKAMATCGKAMATRGIAMQRIFALNM